eukprot:TRINITY_DN36213_c0_g1_i1.p1 TRINITY_DN36213_c0_g1~~TRINITY_DN36213_c0_g1_i1.p1  ORF type:complete len:420 (+),score=23.93 TRINITY_DN36213_c0_g1_i1:193-1452(+)
MDYSGRPRSGLRQQDWNMFYAAVVFTVTLPFHVQLLRTGLPFGLTQGASFRALATLLPLLRGTQVYVPESRRLHRSSIRVASKPLPNGALPHATLLRRDLVKIPHGGYFCDLGSGTGRCLRAASRAGFSDCRGADLNFLLVAMSRCTLAAYAFRRYAQGLVRSRGLVRRPPMRVLDERTIRVEHGDLFSTRFPHPRCGSAPRASEASLRSGAAEDTLPPVVVQVYGCPQVVKRIAALITGVGNPVTENDWSIDERAAGRAVAAPPGGSWCEPPPGARNGLAASLPWDGVGAPVGSFVVAVVTPVPPQGVLVHATGCNVAVRPDMQGDEAAGSAAAAGSFREWRMAGHKGPCTEAYADRQLVPLQQLLGQPPVCSCASASASGRVCEACKSHWEALQAGVAVAAAARLHVYVVLPVSAAV